MSELINSYLGYLQQPLYFYPALFILGLVVGSFLNVAIYRLPIMLERQWFHDCVSYLTSLKHTGQDLTDTLAGDQTINIQMVSKEQVETPPAFNLFWPPSHCPSCKHEIGFWENIPLFSYTYLLGKCRQCKAHIPIRYFAIELFTGFASIVVGYTFGYSLQLPFALLFTYGLITLTFIDIDKQILPDDITLLGLWIGLLISLQSVFVSPSEAILGAAGGYLTFWIIYWVFKLFTQKEGMGYGDFKLLACAGAWLGWQHLPIVIFIASITGTVWGLASILMKLSDKEQPMPFGPFIALGMWLTFILGDEIVATYLQWAY